MLQDIELLALLRLLLKKLGKLLDIYQYKIASNYSFYTINKVRIQKHYNNIYQRAQSSKNTMLYKRVKVQIFFYASSLQQYFIIKAAGSNSRLSNYPRLNIIKEQLVEQKLTIYIYKEQAYIIDAKVAKIDKIGQFKQIGQLEHFISCNLIYLIYQIQLLDYKKVKLQQVVKLIELLVERSIKRLLILT